MKFLCEYDEFYPNKGFPSIKPLLHGTEYSGRKEAIAYMCSGRPFLVSTKIPDDIVTGEHGVGGIAYRDDGDYTWSSELTYYVDKYNMRLPQDFIDHAKKKVKLLNLDINKKVIY